MVESIEPKPLPIQFSVRTLLLVTTNVALLAAVGQISNHAFADMGVLIKGYGVLLTIYTWRFKLIRYVASARTKWTALLILFSACLPYIYVCIGSMFNEPFGLPRSKWFGSPIWIFAIPSLSFAIFDLNNKWCSPLAYLVRSLVEIVIVFHIWSFVWIWTQLIMGWAWI